MKRTVVTIMALCLAVLAPGPVSAAGGRRTETTATVPGSNELENFGAYTLEGTVIPARRGQVVRFSYKRAGGDEWRRFKVAGDDGVDGTGFYVLGRDAPRDRIGDGRAFSTEFTPSVAPGKWLLRAVFPAQDGYARSADIVRVEVRGSD